MPSLAARPAFLAAVARPFLRRMSRAVSRSPVASTRAALHSIMPAPVSSRSLRTISAVMSIVSSLGASSLQRKAAGESGPERPLTRRRVGDRGSGACGTGAGIGARLGRGARAGVVLAARGALVRRGRFGRPRLAQPAAGQHGVGDAAGEQPIARSASSLPGIT